MSPSSLLGPHVRYIPKPDSSPCSITDSIKRFPTEEATEGNATSPPMNPPTNLTVVTVEGCPSFVILDWEKPPNDTVTGKIMDEDLFPTWESLILLCTGSVVPWVTLWCVQRIWGRTCLALLLSKVSQGRKRWPLSLCGPPVIQQISLSCVSSLFSQNFIAQRGDRASSFISRKIYEKRPLPIFKPGFLSLIPFINWPRAFSEGGQKVF